MLFIDSDNLKKSLVLIMSCLWVTSDPSNVYFAVQALFVTISTWLTYDHAENLGGGWASCLSHTDTAILFLIQFYSLIVFYFCLCNDQPSLC